MYLGPGNNGPAVGLRINRLLAFRIRAFHNAQMHKQARRTSG